MDSSFHEVESGKTKESKASWKFFRFAHRFLLQLDIPSPISQAETKRKPIDRKDPVASSDRIAVSLRFPLSTTPCCEAFLRRE